MTRKSRRFSSDCNFRVALEIAKGQQTLDELSGERFGRIWVVDADQPVQ